MKKIIKCGVFAAAVLLVTGTSRIPQSKYHLPAEDGRHEGTWLAWPHGNTYGAEYRDELEPIWLQMVCALHEGENVHIVAYDEGEKARIVGLLEDREIDMSRVDFVIAQSDDVWVRDIGPMFVEDEKGSLLIADFAFDGWGGKVPYKRDDAIPRSVAAANGFQMVSIPDFVLEGGSVEMDGKGTAMACKSSVVSPNRNRGMSVLQAVEYLSRYLGAMNFIWLEGVVGEDITDAHIDGIARFYDDTTMLTVSEQDFYELYEGIRPEDYEALLSARNAAGEPYDIITLPMTAKNAKGLDYKGSYLNYYVGNQVVLLPVYSDENDEIATEILSKLYEDRKVVPINVNALYQYGGMLHCVTSQQPYR